MSELCRTVALAENSWATIGRQFLADTSTPRRGYITFNKTLFLLASSALMFCHNKVAAQRDVLMLPAVSLTGAAWCWGRGPAGQQALSPWLTWSWVTWLWLSEDTSTFTEGISWDEKVGGCVFLDKPSEAAGTGSEGQWVYCMLTGPLSCPGCSIFALWKPFTCFPLRDELLRISGFKIKQLP